MYDGMDNHGEDQGDIERISTKTHNRLGDQVKEELPEVKMSMIRKRSQDDNQKKTYDKGRCDCVGYGV